MADQALIFFHIHKTGGLTLAAVMQRQYPKGAVRWLWIQEPDTIRDFLALSDEERSRIRAVTGHMPFGYHTHFPQGARYITLLRDPVKRFISEYRHLCDVPEDWGTWQAPDNVLESVESYLDYVVSNRLANAQTRMIGGFMDYLDRPPLAPLPPDALERAKENLDKYFAVVGATERFDESLVLMQQILGWPKSLHYMRKNVRERQALRSPVSDATMERIREAVALDTELVAYGAKLLDAQIQEFGPAIKEQLTSLKRVNARLEKLLRFAHLPAVRSIRAVPGLRQFYNLTGTIVRRFT